MGVQGLRQQSDAGHVPTHAIVELTRHLPALLGLALGQAPLQFPAIAQIAKDTGEALEVVDLADREIQRERRAVLAEPDHFTTDADDAGLLIFR